MKFLVLFFLGMSISPFLFAAGFDCEKATTLSEKKVCEHERLGQLDEMLSNYYSDLTAEFDKIKREQIEWIKKRESCGSDTFCIAEAYTQRINKLKNKFLTTFPYKYKKPTELFNSIAVDEGVYPETIEYAGEYGDFLIYPLDNERVIFYFHGRNGHNSGTKIGVFKIVDDVAIYEDQKSYAGDCKWKVTFSQEKLVVETLEGKSSCGFGANVRARGRHRRYSSEVPQTYKAFPEGSEAPFEDLVKKYK